MPFSRGQEMTEQAHTQICGNGEKRYATRGEFLQIFDQHMNALYQLSFLLTGDHQKAERCFVTGIEDCAKENRVFREWARAWAKRVIVENAIRELHPRRSYSNSSALLPAVFSHNQQSRGPIGPFDLDAVLGLADFERFVFVLCVLEHYREHECALLLGCSASEVRDARTRAIEELASSGEVASSRYEDRKLGQLAAARVS
jgi:DNA-directed RNA polymerase specialized sigma24 family protein